MSELPPPPAVPARKAPRGICIAIDGPAASGKGTVARAVARKLGYSYLDTGAMYRAVALLALRQGTAVTDASGLATLAASLDLGFSWDGEHTRVTVHDQDLSAAIRTQEVGQAASAVAVHPAVRAALVERQRSLAAQGRVVVDGRDIGSVVLPQAELKIYLDASLDERARRRHVELTARSRASKTAQPTLSEVRDELAARDAQDSGRQTGPLCQARGAVRVDTTRRSIAEVIDLVVELAQRAGA